MSTPEFVLELRKKIGHDLLWLNGVTGCVLNEHGQLLLGRRSDTGEWAMVYGINEPGEQPADTVVREIKEETGIDAIVTDLVAVTSSNKVLTYANGSFVPVRPEARRQCRAVRRRRGKPERRLVRSG